MRGLLSVVLLAVVLFAGCGGDGDRSGTNAPTETAKVSTELEPATTTTPRPELTTTTLLAHRSGTGEIYLTADFDQDLAELIVEMNSQIAALCSTGLATIDIETLFVDTGSTGLGWFNCAAGESVDKGLLLPDGTHISPGGALSTDPSLVMDVPSIAVPDITVPGYEPVEIPELEPVEVPDRSTELSQADNTLACIELEGWAVANGAVTSRGYAQRREALGCS